MIENKNRLNFYLKPFLLVWGIGLVVYSFMIFQFWWGNHDWGYLKEGIFINSVFFEARYTQTLPTVLFFEGQIVPVGFALFSLAMLSCLCLIMGKYLYLREKTYLYVLFSLIIVALPYTPIIFYYVFIMFSLTFWGCFAVGLLFLSEGSKKWWKFGLGSIGFFLLLGSYPPILGLILTLFVGRRLKNYITQNETFFEVVRRGFFLFGQMIIGFIGFKLMTIYMQHQGLMNPEMYNLRVRTPMEIAQQIGVELLAPLTAIAKMYQSFGGIGVLFYVLVLFAGIITALYQTQHKFITLVLICGMFLASRISFILSASSYYGVFRVCWWGEIGLVAVFLSFILNVNKKVIRNLVLALICFFLFVFIRTDFEIQKVQKLGFQTERLFQKRVGERLMSSPQFEINVSYATLVVGYLGMQQKFCNNGCRGNGTDLFNMTILPFDLGQILFWDEIKSPTFFKYGVWSKLFWTITDKSSILPRSSFFINDIYDFRYWAYMQSHKYPHKDSIYIGDNTIVFRFDDLFFNQYKEMIVKELSKK